VEDCHPSDRDEEARNQNDVVPSDTAKSSRCIFFPRLLRVPRPRRHPCFRHSLPLLPTPDRPHPSRPRAEDRARGQKYRPCRQSTQHLHYHSQRLRDQAPAGRAAKVALLGEMCGILRLENVTLRSSTHRLNPCKFTAGAGGSILLPREGGGGPHISSRKPKPKLRRRKREFLPDLTSDCNRSEGRQVEEERKKKRKRRRKMEVSEVKRGGVDEIVWRGRHRCVSVHPPRTRCKVEPHRLFLRCHLPCCVAAIMHQPALHDRDQDDDGILVRIATANHSSPSSRQGCDGRGPGCTLDHHSSRRGDARVRLHLH
jgi:hypothetical protein